ncbi:MAG: hypothetical protein ACJAT2_002922 [Bacteriovoracaceae bacterium]|jgi:hypothetical protein
MEKWILKTLGVVFLLQIAHLAKAQDERFTRELLSGDLTRIVAPQSESKYNYKVRSPFYEVDLNEDHKSESFVVEKKDGEDWVYVYNYSKEKIYSFKLDTTGAHSRLYRITSKSLSKDSKVFVLHFFEGVTQFLKFKAQARFYFLTIDKNDLSSISTYKGPAFWEEFKSFKHNHYHQRKYVLTAIDLNLDGVKELTLSYNDTRRVYFYKGNGSWQTF